MEMKRTVNVHFEAEGNVRDARVSSRTLLNVDVEAEGTEVTDVSQ